MGGVGEGGRGLERVEGVGGVVGWRLGWGRSTIAPDNEEMGGGGGVMGSWLY